MVVEGASMSAFEFVFSLIGLALGLSLVEVLGGLARTLKARRAVRIGWLTPLLGIWVIGDVTSFWGMTWGVRESIEAQASIWPVLGIGVLFTCTYYIAASLVFPERATDVPDLDEHYWEHRRQVIGLIILCELTAMAISLWHGEEWRPVVWAINICLISAAVFTAIVPGRKANLAGLGVLLAITVWIFSF
jgi:hypothetical protein